MKLHGALMAVPPFSSTLIQWFWGTLGTVAVETRKYVMKILTYQNVKALSWLFPLEGDQEERVSAQIR